MDENTFNNACAEFFWEIQNVVKGLKRDELSSAMFLRDIAMRDIGIEVAEAHGFHYPHLNELHMRGYFARAMKTD